MNIPEHSQLGKASTYVDQYTPSLLYPLPRATQRQTIGVGDRPVFVGADLLGLVSRKFIGLPIWGSVIKQSEHINFFNETSVTKVIEALGFTQVADSRYKPSSGVPVLDVSALGVLFRRN